MAGIITHFMLCRQALYCKDLNRDLKKILNRYSNWLYIGSASPDLAYATITGTQSEWANTLHKRNTNGIPNNGYIKLKAEIGEQGLFSLRIAWLCGYISHLVADATIHPVVETLVGPYDKKENQPNHMICEKVQDSLLFYDLNNGQDITRAEFTDRFVDIDALDDFCYVMIFWKQLLESAYKQELDTKHIAIPKPIVWYEFFRELFDVSDSKAPLVMVSRHLGIKATKQYVYSSRDDLRKNESKLCGIYYDKVRLPNGIIGSFREYVFDYAATNIVDIWNRFYNGFHEDYSPTKDIKNWDLDTGRVIDNPTERTYWKEN